MPLSPRRFTGLLSRQISKAGCFIASTRKERRIQLISSQKGKRRKKPSFTHFAPSCGYEHCADERPACLICQLTPALRPWPCSFWTYSPKTGPRFLQRCPTHSPAIRPCCSPGPPV